MEETLYFIIVKFTLMYDQRYDETALACTCTERDPLLSQRNLIIQCEKDQFRRRVCRVRTPHQCTCSSAAIR